MPEHEQPTSDGSTGEGTAGHLQEYFAGVAGKPPKEALEYQAQPVRVVTLDPGPPAENAVVSEADEMSRLRQLLHQKDHVIFRSVVETNELKSELEATKAETETLKGELAEVLRRPESGEPSKEKPGLSPQALEEISRQRKEWLRIQKSLEMEHSQRKAELVKVRGQWFATQQQLDQESKARRAERAQANWKIAGLEKNLEHATSAVASLQAANGKSRLRRGTVAVAASVLLALGGGATIWSQFPVHASNPATAAVSSPKPVTRVAERPPSIISPVSQRGFQGSLGHLNQALSAFGSRRPEEVLQEVRTKSGDPSICAFLWNNGQPAVIFNGGGLKENLATSLSRCATAVEAMK